MTRSASPNGAVEFSYDFPVAGPSHLPTTPTRTHHIRAHTQPRTRSPTRPRWEADEEDSVDDDEIDYDAFGYPRVGLTHRAATHPMPTRNQWRAPSPPLYPYADAYTYATYTSNPYTYPAPLLLAPAPSGTSCESNNSVLSSCARSCRSLKSAKESKTHREHAKIRKPRRSLDVDSDSAPAPSSFSTTITTSSSPASSPYFSSFSDEFDSEDDEDASPSDDEHEQEKENSPTPAPTHHGLGLRRQWDALSLRVRFGVFRAKRRMRKRVMSL
ncbi:hypothetical protein B0H19DRAFT_1180488 [Mycena capillaripes]|nr:hypothetical protein B0H19DRAFT_1180488 [Mycena capillaripes]